MAEEHDSWIGKAFGITWFDNVAGGPTPLPPEHEDPLVGQNKLVDPEDQTLAGVKGTFDGKGIKIKGIYTDLPGAGGDPLDTQADTPGGDPAITPTKYNHLPAKSCPPGSVPEPSGIGGCRTVTPPDIQVPLAPPAQPGDYNVPADDSGTA